MIGYTLPLCASLLWCLDLTKLKCYGNLSELGVPSWHSLPRSSLGQLFLLRIPSFFVQFKSRFPSVFEPSEQPLIFLWLMQQQLFPLYLCHRDQAAHLSILPSILQWMCYTIPQHTWQSVCAGLHLDITAPLTCHISSVLGLIHIIFLLFLHSFGVPPQEKAWKGTWLPLRTLAFSFFPYFSGMMEGRPMSSFSQHKFILLHYCLLQGSDSVSLWRRNAFYNYGNNSNILNDTVYKLVFLFGKV